MLKNIIVLACLCLYFNSLYGQNRIIPQSEIKQQIHANIDNNYTPEFGGYYSLANAHTIDTAKLRIIYDMTVKVDTALYNDRVVAEVGTKYSKFYSLLLWELSANYSDRSRNVSYDWMRSSRVMFAATIFIDKYLREISNQILMPYEDAQLCEYREPIPHIDWKLGSVEREIIGYKCTNAFCRYAGRDWEVWYAVDIPSEVGFWKLSGLPGMILAAESAEGEYKFSAISIAQPQSAMTSYRMRIKSLSRKRILSAEKRLYANPMVSFFAKTGQDYYVVFRDGKMEYVSQDALLPMPYNPIELE